MEPSEKKLNDDLVVFMRKRSETDAPRYTARLKTYVDFQQKRRRAAAARKQSEHAQREQARKKTEGDVKDRPSDQCEHKNENGEHMSRRRGGVCTQGHTGFMSRSRSRSHEPADACCGRRRRRRSRRRRRRRRSCRRRRRRRRSCRRRRRRSRSRRRRRRSCGRRRRRRRRCR